MRLSLYFCLFLLPLQPLLATLHSELNPAEPICTSTPFHQKALYHAARKGDLESLTTLLTEASDLIDINQRDLKGKTPLFLAAQSGHVSVVRELLAHGAEKERINRLGRTPLHTAIDNGHLKVVRALLDAGANLEAKDIEGDSPLTRAILTGHLSIVQELLARGALMDSCDYDGVSTVHCAVFACQPEILLELLAQGAPFSSLDTESGTPPIVWAVEQFGPGTGKILKYLLFFGEGLNTRDADMGLLIRSLETRVLDLKENQERILAEALVTQFLHAWKSFKKPSQREAIRCALRKIRLRAELRAEIDQIFAEFTAEELPLPTPISGENR